MIGNIKFERKMLERKMLERTYYDTVNIYRNVKIKKDGETKHSRELIYENQKCAISKNSLPANNQSDSVNHINYTVTLFIAPEVKIKQGDLLEIIHMGGENKYIAGEPFVYVTHQEIILEREDRA